MKNIGLIFSKPPYGTPSGKEALDSLLALSAFSENISVYFINEGIFQLISPQNPEKILMKNYIPMFKILDIYDINQRFICKESLDFYHISSKNLIINAELIDKKNLQKNLQRHNIILTF